MATSGIVGAATMDLATILEHAFRRCRLSTSVQTPERVQMALENLQMLVNEWSSYELNLWCIEKIIVGFLQFKESYVLPSGTVDVLNVYNRDSPAVSGTLTSSDGQGVTALQDGNVLTFLTQTVTGGFFLFTFPTTTAVRTVGFLHQGTAVRSIVFEVSQDNIVWTIVKTLTANTTYSDSTWYWNDIDPTITGLYFRMRDTATNAPLSAYEFFAAADGREITMARMNRADFTTLPNKFSQGGGGSAGVSSTNGGRPLQFWFDRQLTNSVIHIWPSPGISNIFEQMIIWRHRLVQDVGTDLTMDLEIPQKWRNVVVAGLASRIALEIKEVDPALIPLLNGSYTEALKLAGADEIDKSPLILRPNLRPYTQ